LRSWRQAGFCNLVRDFRRQGLSFRNIGLACRGIVCANLGDPAAVERRGFLGVDLERRIEVGDRLVVEPEPQQDESPAVGGRREERARFRGVLQRLVAIRKSERQFATLQGASVAAIVERARQPHIRGVRGNPQIVLLDGLREEAEVQKVGGQRSC